MAEKKTVKKVEKKAEMPKEEKVMMARVIKPLVNIRKAPEGTVVSVAQKNEAYKVIEAKDGWVKTVKGYVRADLVKIEEA